MWFHNNLKLKIAVKRAREMENWLKALDSLLTASWGACVDCCARGSLTGVEEEETVELSVTGVTKIDEVVSFVEGEIVVSVDGAKVVVCVIGKAEGGGTGVVWPGAGAAVVVVVVESLFSSGLSSRALLRAYPPKAPPAAPSGEN